MIKVKTIEYRANQIKRSQYKLAIGGFDTNTEKALRHPTLNTTIIFYYGNHNLPVINSRNIQIDQNLLCFVQSRLFFIVKYCHC